MKNKAAALAKLTEVVDTINSAYLAGALTDDQYDTIDTSISSLLMDILKED